MDNEQKQKMLQQQRSQAALLDAQQPDEDEEDDESKGEESPEDQLASDQQQSRIANSENASSASNESEDEADAPEKEPEGEDRVSDIKKQKLEERKKKAEKEKESEEVKQEEGQEPTGDMAAMLDRAMSTGPALPYWINVKLGMSLWNYIFFRKQDAKSPFFPIIRPLQWKNLNPSLPLGVPLPNFVLHIIVLTIDFFVVLWYVIQFVIFILVATAPYLLAAGGIAATIYGIRQLF